MNSLLEQAKNFYVAAQNSPIKSQPLLYYYSFLNFSKLIINMTNNYGSSRNYFHGIRAENNSAFSSSEIVIFPTLNPNKLQVSAELYDTLEGKNLTSSLRLNIKDLLGHCVGIHRTYCETYGIKEEYFCKLTDAKLYRKASQLVFRAQVQCNNSQFVRLCSAGYHINKSTVSHKECYQLEESYNMSAPYYQIPRKEIYNFSQILRSKGIWYYIGKDGFVNYLSTNTSLRYPTEFIIYNSMFFFGSITRYQPYLFDNIFSDKEQWLMSEFLTTEPKQFLYSVTAKVLGQDIQRAYADF